MQKFYLEAKIAKNKDLYYEALAASQHGWHEGTEDVVPFIKSDSSIEGALRKLVAAGELKKEGIVTYSLFVL